MPANEEQAQSFLTTTSIDQADPAIPASVAAATVPAKPEKDPSMSSTREPQSPSFLTTISIGPTEPAASAWAAATIASSAPAGSATEVLPTVAQPSTATGGIRVQVARVQTQSEAYALVVRLISQHGAEFDPSMLKIERGVANGKMVAYLVRLGPFANVDQAQQRCSALHRTGFDCVVQY